MGSIWTGGRGRVSSALPRCHYPLDFLHLKYLQVMYLKGSLMENEKQGEDRVASFGCCASLKNCVTNFRGRNRKQYGFEKLVNKKSCW